MRLRHAEPVDHLLHLITVDDWDAVHRKLGYGEFQQGRSLDALQAAYRVGVQVAWRRVADVASRRRLPSQVMTQLADALFSYIDELASLTVQGYLEARSRSADEVAGEHRRLLRLVLRPGAPGGALAETAKTVGWTVPPAPTRRPPVRWAATGFAALRSASPPPPFTTSSRGRANNSATRRCRAM